MQNHRFALALLLSACLLAAPSISQADTYNQYSAKIKKCWKDYRTHQNKLTLSLCIADAAAAFVDQKASLFGSLFGALSYVRDGKVHGGVDFLSDQSLSADVALIASVGPDGTLVTRQATTPLNVFIVSEDLLGDPEQDLDANSVEWTALGSSEPSESTGGWSIHIDTSNLRPGNYLVAVSMESDPSNFNTDTAGGSPIAFIALTAPIPPDEPIWDVIAVILLVVLILMVIMLLRRRPQQS